MRPVAYSVEGVECGHRGAASICTPRHGRVKLITRGLQIQILPFSARAWMMPSMNVRLFTPHSQSQAIGSLSL
jgi:hypothetical protein